MPRTRRGDKHTLRPSTKVLTEGFDPTLSLGSARPAVFRSSTYVFSSPEAAEHAFNVTSRPHQAARRRRAGPNLLALQPSQRANARGPDREPRERFQVRAGIQLRHGRDRHIAVHSFAPRPIHRLHHSDLRRHAAFHSGLPLAVGRLGHSRSLRTTPIGSTARSRPRKISAR